MYDAYKRRMMARGKNMSEMLRMQSNMVVEQTWERDPNYRQVYVVKVNHGLPKITAEHELIDVKFNIDTYQKVGVDEPSYYLQFRHGAEKHNSDIGIGSYVYMRDEDGEWKWWMIVSLDERPQFRQYHILETSWKLGWVVNGTIYHHLVVLRGNSSGDTDENLYTSIVDGSLSVWIPTTDDSVSIGYNQRFLISDGRRNPPLAWEVTRVDDTKPIGLTKLKLQQSTFDISHDNAELMLANYYDTFVLPVEQEAKDEHGEVKISYSGAKPTIKVGGSYKTFTATFSNNNATVDHWVVSDENGDISGNTDYLVETDGESLKIKVAKNYNLIGTVLKIKVVGSDNSKAQVDVEVI